MTKSYKNNLKDIQTRLLNSHQFKNSKNSKALLNYLIKCSINGIIPKEITIAMDVFHKDEGFYPGEDPLVRVHIHNLRKKLEEYYKNEGKNEKYHIEIPKGQYIIQLSVPDEKKQPKLQKNKKRLLFDSRFYIIGLSFLCLILLINNFKYSTRLQQFKIVDQDDPIWGKFMAKQKKSVIVCGDHFYYNIPIEYNKRSVHVRDTWINSKEDFQYLIFPEKTNKIQPSDQTYFPHSIIWGLPGIIKIFNSSPRQIVIRPSSSLTATLLEEQNMVFIGNLRSLGLLSHYVTEAQFQFNNRERILHHFTDTDTIDYVCEANEDLYHKDYALIIKWQGPRENTILIITSFFTIGVKEATRYLTDKNLLKLVEARLEESCGIIPDNFKIVMEVTGIKQAITESKFVVVKSLNDQSLTSPFMVPLPDNSSSVTISSVK